MPATPPNPKFFATPAAFREWLSRNHKDFPELWVGFHKKGSSKPSITWPESVDEALCFGWIDGLRKSIDATCYVIRFTPRKPRSNWSVVNCGRIKELSARGRMREAGLRAFDARVREKSGVYSFEQRKAARFDAASEREFRTDREAWVFFQAQPPGYRRTATWFVISAKRAETRQKRLARLIEDSAKGLTIRELRRPVRTS